MRINKLKLNNFRNIENSEVLVNSGITVFYGGVGEGKTNLLESIFMLSVGRSYRTSESEQMILWGKSEAVIRGEGQNGNGAFAVAVQVSKTGKRIELNGISTRSLDLIGGLRTVVFHGDDAEIVSGSPHQRRRFLDIAISQASKNYAFNLRDYHRALKQRNAALLQGRPLMQTDWDDQLSSTGAWLTQVRANAIKDIEKTAERLHEALSGEKNKLEIRYMPSGDISAEGFRTKLSRNMGMDLSRGSTSVGPHRDDFKIVIGGVDARHYASTGEKKTIALALKLAEVEFMRQVSGEKPILLLDDVFSTLDIKRSRSLLGVAADATQCLITITDLNMMKDHFGGNEMLYEVKGGKIRQAN